jgi:hypothetical protein
MNNLSTLGVITSFIFSVSLNGASVNAPEARSTTDEPDAYVVNHSNSTIYYKPESLEDNPGLDPRSVYEIRPGQSLFAPVDAISTSVVGTGKIYRVPTGAKIIVNEMGIPEPANLIAKAALLLPSYGTVAPPSEGFAMLSNAKMVIYQAPDIKP